MSLNRQRGVVRRKITLLEQFMEEYQVSEFSELELKQKLDNIVIIKRSIDDLQKSYCLNSDDADVEQSIEQLEDLQGNVEKIAKIQSANRNYLRKSNLT